LRRAAFRAWCLWEPRLGASEATERTSPARVNQHDDGPAADQEAAIGFILLPLTPGKLLARGGAAVGRALDSAQKKAVRAAFFQACKTLLDDQG
jgi:hypothetical protein